MSAGMVDGERASSNRSGDDPLPAVRGVTPASSAPSAGSAAGSRPPQPRGDRGSMMTGLVKARSAAEEEEARRSIRGGARLGDVGRPVRLDSRGSRGCGERQRPGGCALGCLANANGVGDISGMLRRGLPCREEPFRSESALHDREFPRKGLPCLGNTSLCRGLS